MAKIKVYIHSAHYCTKDDYVELECPGIPRVGDWFSLPKEAERKLIRKALRCYKVFEDYVDWVYGDVLSFDEAYIVSSLNWWADGDDVMGCYVALDTSIRRGNRREDVRYRPRTREEYERIKENTLKYYHLSDDKEE